MSQLVNFENFKILGVFCCYFEATDLTITSSHVVSSTRALRWALFSSMG